MHCRKHGLGPDMEVCIEVDRAKVEYDTANYAFVEREVAESEDSHVLHQVSDIWDSGNRDLMERILDLAYAEVVELLYPYTKTPIDTAAGEGSETEGRNFRIEMRVPRQMSQSTLEYLHTLIHQYFVYRVMREWMSVANTVNPVSKANYEEKIEEVRSKLRNAIKWRRGGYRISQHALD